MRIKGGLGNQLFQYAAVYSLSKRLKQPFQFNPAFTATMTPRGCELFELMLDNNTIIVDEKLPKKVRIIKNSYINKAFRLLNLSEHSCDDYLYWLETKDKWQPEFFTIEATNLYVDGYFQSEDYFKEYRDDLLRQFRPNYKAEKPYMDVIDSIYHFNSVAVHVRRRDFENDNHPFHYLLEEDYYTRAMDYIRKRVNTPIFFWFSDDIEWVKKHIGYSHDYVFVSIRTRHRAIDDMMLMKNCKHIITANSTFSWWAAWLNEHNNAIKIVPERPYGIDEMIPKSWQKIETTSNRL